MNCYFKDRFNIYKNALFLVLFTVVSFCFIYNVSADSIEYFGDGGISYGGGGGGGGSNSFYGYLGYRFTLVDQNGNKVNGTRSVDFQYWDTGNDSDSKILTYDTSNLLYQNYKYRFGENNSSDYIRVGLRVLPFRGNIYSPDSHAEFINKYILENGKNNSFTVPKTTNKVDFVSLFLYYSNFIKDPGLVKPYGDLLNDFPTLNNYYICVELLVGLGTQYSSVILSKVGTSNEALEYMYNSKTDLGYAYRDNMSDEKLTFACGLFTTPNFKEKYGNFGSFDTYFNSYDDCVRETLANYSEKKANNSNATVYLWTGNSCKTKGTMWAYAIEGLKCGDTNVYGRGIQMENLQNYINNKENYAVGVAMISMNFNSNNVKKQSFLKICKNAKVSFSTNFSVSNLNNDLFVQNGSDGNQKVYCYDNVEYDYSKVVDVLGGVKAANTIIENGDGDGVPIINAKVTRTCTSSDYNALSSFDATTEIEDDYNKNINVNVYGSNYKFVPRFNNSGFSADNKSLSSTYTYSFEYAPSEKIIVKNSSIASSNGYIDFSDYSNMFGASNSYIKDILKYDNSLCSKLPNATNCNNSFELQLINSSKNLDGKCDFTYEVDAPKSKSNSNSFYKFRVISLENPFPGKDGTSRMPAKNWFYSDNYVYDYIMNNRGIKYVMKDANASPELMYSKVEPMYSITLTPSTMMKIREYNKKYSYYSMYDTTGYEKMSNGDKAASQVIKEKDYSADKLICKNGRECFSKFLRDSKIIPQNDLTGSCVLIKNTTNEQEIRSYLSDNYEKYNNIDAQPLYDYVFSGGTPVSLETYDLNKNFRIDRQDYEILFKWQADSAALTGSNTLFYTCANKSYFSGGPISVGGE